MGHRSHHESTSACTLVDVAAPNSFFMVICSHIVEICWHMDITVQSYHLRFLSTRNNSKAYHPKYQFE